MIVILVSGWVVGWIVVGLGLIVLWFFVLVLVSVLMALMVCVSGIVLV